MRLKEKPIQDAIVSVKSQDGHKILGQFSVSAFILPRKEEFSSSEAAERAKNKQ